MRTFKQNVIHLDGGDRIELRFAGASLQFEAIDDEPNYRLLEVVVPHGTVLSGMAKLSDEHVLGEILFQANPEHGLKEEVHGPLRFIAFLSEAYPDEDTAPEFSSLTHPKLADTPPRGGDSMTPLIGLQWPERKDHLTKKSLIEKLEDFEDDHELVVTLPLSNGEFVSFYLADEVGDGWKPSGIIELQLGEFGTG